MGKAESKPELAEAVPDPDLTTEDPKELLLDRFYGTIYGNCIGDAIGLLTEFMTKEEAAKYYAKFVKGEGLEYSQKVPDFHRSRWEEGDWTDDSDQMILILLSLLEHDGQIEVTDFASRLREWRSKGIPELGDVAGMGIGRTTSAVLGHPEFLTDPHKAATHVWESSQRKIAPNGGVMRTSILGIHDFKSIEKVVENTVNICKVTHADTRCVASCVAVTTAIAFMLQKQDKHLMPNGALNIDSIINDAYEQAVQFIDEDSYKKELRSHMFAKKIDDLKLSDAGKIGYTLKAMGAGFWGLRQKDFRKALTVLTMEGGDADSNGAVAGALLGCRLGLKGLPESWVNGLKHKEWLDNHLERYLEVLKKMETMPCDEAPLSE